MTASAAAVHLALFGDEGPRHTPEAVVAWRLCADGTFIHRSAIVDGQKSPELDPGDLQSTITSGNPCLFSHTYGVVTTWRLGHSVLSDRLTTEHCAGMPGAFCATAIKYKYCASYQRANRDVAITLSDAAALLCGACAPRRSALSKGRFAPLAQGRCDFH